jgi:hypothetical protein
MQIALDRQPHADVALFVRTAPPSFTAPPGGMMS